MWTFEPHVAEDILFRMLNESRNANLFSTAAGECGKNTALVSLGAIQMENGKVYRARGVH